MDRSSRIAQAYGYAVCLIAVITILISLVQIVNALFNLSDPLRAEGFGRGAALTSFAAYKRSVSNPQVTMRPDMQPAPAPGSTKVDSVGAPPSETELRQAFEDERLDQIGNVRFRSMRTLVTSGLMIVFAVVLFFTHWRWLRREELKA